MSNPPELILRRQCAGRCGTTIAYVLEAGSFGPELHSDGLIAFKDGHLCAACESVVEASLATRRTAIAAAEFTDRRGPLGGEAFHRGSPMLRRRSFRDQRQGCK